MHGSIARRWKGFTILELLITLFVISILAAIAIPGFFGRPEVTLENASILLAHDLRAAQNRSAYMAEPCSFVFTEDGEGYRVLGPDGEVILHPATGLPFIRHYAEDAVFEGVFVDRVECGGDRAIEYDAQGRALEGALVRLVFAGDQRTLEVQERRGTVSILNSTSGWTDEGY